jgi:hypothetical protein
VPCASAGPDASAAAPKAMAAKNDFMLVSR